MRITITNGPHKLPETVLSVELPEGAEPEGALVDTTHPKRPLPWQLVGKDLYFQAPALGPGKKRTLKFDTSKTYPARYKSAELKDEGGRLQVDLAGKPFTTYLYEYELPQTRPVFYPVLGPRGIPATRAWPIEEKAGENQDHPHHRSLFFAHGDVNGSDFWSEAEGAAVQVHKSFGGVSSGRFVGGFSERVEWRKRTGETVMGETRVMRFYNVRGNLRVFDVDMTFHAEQGEVKFGDTKEGGLISFRVATPMKEANTGRIENGCGGVGEAQCWGKPAPWVDYSGIVKGKRLGIAVFDHCENLRHPTRWHVRAYGLFSLNPFGLSYYKYGRERNGDFVLGSGDSLRFRFRVLIHQGDARRGKVSEHYLAWAFPPGMTVEE